MRTWAARNKKTILTIGSLFAVFFFGMYLSALIHPSNEDRLVLHMGVVVDKEQHIIYTDGARFIKTSGAVLPAGKNEVSKNAYFLVVRGLSDRDRSRFERWEVVNEATFKMYRKNEIVYRDRETDEVIKRQNVLKYIDEFLR